MSTWKRIGLILLPWLLLLSTYLAFRWSVTLLGLKSGFLAGYLFYWLIWCFGIPILILGPAKVLSLFKINHKLSWLVLTLMLIPMIIAFLGIPFWPNLLKLTPLIGFVSLFSALINGTGEELFWRGLYSKSFPDDLFLGYWYPTLMFTLWHLSPRAGGLELLGALLMGLCWGFIAWKTKSIRWTVVSHIIVNLPWLAGFYFF